MHEQCVWKVQSDARVQKEGGSARWQCCNSAACEQAMRLQLRSSAPRLSSAAEHASQLACAANKHNSESKQCRSKSA